LEGFRVSGWKVVCLGFSGFTFSAHGFTFSAHGFTRGKTGAKDGISVVFCPEKSVYLFFAGVVLSLLGSLPPGLISMTVAQTAIFRGFWSAMLLALGAAFSEFFQALGAVVFADWFLAHPAAARIFQMAAIPIFLGLAVHLWFFARPPRTPGTDVPMAPARQFGRGVLVGFFNMLAIPYWAVYTGWLRVNGWWAEDFTTAFVFAGGIVLGTMAALALYAWFGREMTRRSDLVARVANRVVALIFLVLALKLIANVLNLNFY